ncbi:MAG: L-ribulose-5-phosphate 4-epimerase [Planctomycetes bacterium GWF2_41_51]|nr:MAG: L-ribulose-5-phosphate 4-epimerase [Planctomycetes bacterium GWF2_41_51]HBG26866.1 L-ribulose-5-phosphate 4-epimerase [Phycisphaerales bacterium]
MLDQLKKSVCKANLELQKQNLVIYSWGNVSGIDRKTDVVAIKPSGVAYDKLTPEKIVLLDLKGNVIEGKLKPSSDAPTHLEIYRNFPEIGGICHTHSTYATMWAQACREIPPLGTTGADYFYGAVPVTKALTKSQIKNDYELNTGKLIVKRFKNIDPLEMPACLVACHGPFTWGATPEKAVENAVILENTAKLAFGTIMLNLDILPISKNLLDKHFFRKHGKNAYYGQNT